MVLSLGLLGRTAGRPSTARGPRTRADPGALPAERPRALSTLRAITLKSVTLSPDVSHVRSTGPQRACGQIHATRVSACVPGTPFAHSTGVPCEHRIPGAPWWEASETRSQHRFKSRSRDEAHVRGRRSARGTHGPYPNAALPPGWLPSAVRRPGGALWGGASPPAGSRCFWVTRRAHRGQAPRTAPHPMRRGLCCWPRNSLGLLPACIHLEHSSRCGERKGGGK